MYSNLFVPLVLCSAVVVAVPNSYWSAYKKEHAKRYDSPIEDELRRGIFEKNEAEIEFFNAHEASAAGYTRGLNQMSDWTESELSSTLGLRIDEKSQAIRSIGGRKFLDNLLNDNKPVPSSIDWRKVPNRVTGVKNQGKCGSCWAFSTTGLLEGQEVLHSKKSGIGLSEQDLLDCSERNDGCNGGNMVSALSDVSDMDGIDDDISYPYKAVKQTCSYNKTNSIITVTGSWMLAGTDEEELKETVAKYGPLAIGVSATKNWYHYKSGLLYDPDCDEAPMNHGVLLVGYGTEEATGRDYWIIKNSWGEKWGMDGYLLLERNKNNHCNVASFPVMAFW